MNEKRSITETEQEGRVLDQGGLMMKGSVEIETLDENYLRLVRAFPLVAIRDDAHLEEALRLIDQLVDESPRSVGTEDYLNALSDLVSVYEDAHVEAPDVSGVALLRYLMEENGLSQRDLAPFFGAESTVSEVLSGKRRLALSHIERLSAHFGLPADAFIEHTASVPIATG